MIYPFEAEMNPLLTWYPGFHSSKEEFESVILTRLKLFKTKNRGCFFKDKFEDLVGEIQPDLVYIQVLIGWIV